MVISDDVKQVAQGAFLSLVTINADGTPHPIVAGSGKIDGETVVFRAFGMKKTRENLARDNRAWIVGGIMPGDMSTAKGVRLTGTAETKEKLVVFTPAKIESLT
jgi:predicted pyridoxine 5'-phosphate oxidase superfamily flavin-nucleotide-binding protein